VDLREVNMPDPTKPGWKTSEFKLHVLAMALSALFASGLLTNSTALQIAGMAAAWLTAQGYTVSRTILKAGAAALLFATVANSAACGPSSRTKALQASLTTLNAARAGFVAYDGQHQQDLVAHANARADAEASLAAWRTSQHEVELGFSDAYRLIAAAALANDAPSLAAAVGAATAVEKTLHDFGVLK
jgi:hypothetical protein